MKTRGQAVKKEPVYDCGLDQKLIQLRESKHLSQRELAKRLGLSSNTISDYERAVKQPSTKTLIEIAYFYNTSLDYLVNLTHTRPIRTDGLTEDQINAVNEIVEQFRRSNKK